MRKPATVWVFVWLSAMASLSVKAATGQEVVLAFKDLRLRVSAPTGGLASFQYRGKELLSAPALLKLSLFDDRGRNPTELKVGKLTAFKASAAKGQAPARVRFVHEWNGARTETEITLGEAGLRWSVVASVPTPAREAAVEYVVPCLKGMGRVFWPAYGAPFQASEEPSGFDYPSESVLPLATVYKEKEDFGLTAVAPLELRKPGLTVKFDWKAGVLRFLYFHLRLGEPWKATTGLWLVGHAGCWRPGLGWMLHHYPDYFESHPRVLAGEGYYEGCWLFGATMKDPEERKARGVTWVESHSFWPFYGLYVPDQDPWGHASPHKPEDLATFEQGRLSGPRLSRQWIRDYINAYHQQGLQYYAYANTNEAWMPYADKYFADSIVYRPAAPDPEYGGMSIMNAYEGTSWGKHIREQVRRTVECYPEEDGLFLDQNCHRGWHFGADDGVSMVNGKPCCQIGFAQEQMIEFMHQLTAPRNMGIWTNYAGVGVECCRHVHGIMSEAGRPRAQNLQYLCLARPLVICNNDITAELNEERFKSCLSCGAFPPARWNQDRLTKRIVGKYVPLNNLLKGRRWVLHAHALALPPDTEGNIFQAPSGDYLVPFISPKGTQIPARRTPFRLSLPVTIRVPDAEAVKHAYLLSGDYVGPGELVTHRKGEEIQVIVPAHLASSMIVLTREDAHPIVRTSSPMLQRGEQNQAAFLIHLAETKVQRLRVQLVTPWGVRTAEADRKAAGVYAVSLPVAVPGDAPPAEVQMTVSAGTGSDRLTVKEVFSAWVEPPITVSCEASVFIKAATGVLHATALNYTDRSMDVAFATEPQGILLPPPSVRMGPRERREIEITARPAERNTAVRLVASVKGQRIFNGVVKVRVPRAPRSDDLYHEPFSSQSTSGWKVRCGEWTHANGEATARGPAHWVTLPRPEWRDYGLQVATKMDGSMDPTRPWIKSYVFARMDDTESFVRFGFTGQERGPDGFTRVALDRCHKGQYLGTIADGQIPYRSGQWYVLRLEVEEQRARGYVDDKLIVDTTLPEGVPAAGGIGLGVQEDSMVNHYRDLVVYPLGNRIVSGTAAADPVGLWSFDDAFAETMATDSSVNELHGETVDCVGVPGKVGLALRFDGTNSYIVMKGTRSLWTPSFTFAAWVKPETFALKDGHPGPIVFSTYNDWRGPALMLSRDGGVPTLMLRAGPQHSADLAAPEPIPLNQWTHLAATYEAAARKACLYVNGKLVRSLVADSQPGTGHALVLGKWFHCDGGHFTGAMDEVRWFNRALAAEEVGKLCADH